MSNFLSRWLERRSNLATPSPELLALFSSGPTDSGISVSPELALQCPAVFSCVSILSQDVARTPVKLRQQVAPETYVDAVDHDLYEILGALANPELTAYQFKHVLQWQLLLYGRAYAEVVRQDGRIVALWPLYTPAMRVDREARTRRKRWTYTPWWDEPRGPRVLTWLFDASQPPILELTHESPILRCREVIGTALALQQYVAKFFANNARPVGVLTAPGEPTQGTLERLRGSWATSYAGSSNAGKVPVLSGGMKFEAIAANNENAQMTETLRALNEQICGAFRVPSWKAGDTSKTNYSNMETGENTYVVSTLDPFYVSWEEAMRRDLLTARQYGQYTITFDRAALLRNDVKTLHDSLCQGIQNGIYSQNDARKALGMNPIPDGDRYLINSALQPVGANPNVA